MKNSVDSGGSLGGKIGNDTWPCTCEATAAHNEATREYMSGDERHEAKFDGRKIGITGYLCVKKLSTYFSTTSPVSKGEGSNTPLIRPSVSPRSQVGDKTGGEAENLLPFSGLTLCSWFNRIFKTALGILDEGPLGPFFFGTNK
jgi:hypothetical protein